VRVGCCTGGTWHDKMAKEGKEGREEKKKTYIYIYTHIRIHAGS